MAHILMGGSEVVNTFELGILDMPTSGSQGVPYVLSAANRGVRGASSSAQVHGGMRARSCARAQARATGAMTLL